MNNFRNEMLVEIGTEKILLRPTFQNMSEMESNVASVSYLAYKFSRGLRETGANKENEAAKSLPSLTEAAQIIYYNQAERKFTLDEVWEKIISSGNTPKIMVQVTIFIGKMLAGGDFNIDKEVTDDEKKNLNYSNHQPEQTT